jgi:hypothetical protein
LSFYQKVYFGSELNLVLLLGNNPILAIRSSQNGVDKIHFSTFFSFAMIQPAIETSESLLEFIHKRLRNQRKRLVFSC